MNPEETRNPQHSSARNSPEEATGPTLTATDAAIGFSGPCHVSPYCAADAGPGGTDAAGGG